MRSFLTAYRQLSQRDCLPELMDDPDLDPEQHRRALEGLKRVNRWSLSAAIFWPALCDLVRDQPPGRPLTVLDIACGGGDVTRDIARRARRSHLDIQIDGCDINPFAVEYSAAGGQGQKTLPVRFFSLDVLNDDLPEGYDVLMCSLFLHHQSREDAKRLLRRMADAARRSVLVNDLRRTRLGYVLAHIACRLLTRSKVVHSDGPLSVRAAFTSEEALEIAKEAGLAGATVSHHWPQRFLLSWRKPA